MFEHLEAGGQVGPPRSLPPSRWTVSCSWAFWLGLEWLSREPQRCPISARFPHAGITSICYYAQIFIWGLAGWTSVNLGPQACIASILMTEPSPQPHLPIPPWRYRGSIAHHNGHLTLSGPGCLSREALKLPQVVPIPDLHFPTPGFSSLVWSTDLSWIGIDNYIRKPLGGIILLLFIYSVIFAEHWPHVVNSRDGFGTQSWPLWSI